MKNQLKYLLALFILILMVSLSIIWYKVGQPHPNTHDLVEEVTIKAEELFSAFHDDESSASKVYLNKVLVVQGKVLETYFNQFGATTIVLKSNDELLGISCLFERESDQTLSSITIGDHIAVKGICVGKLMDVNLSRCILL